MKKNIGIFIIGIVFAPFLAFAADIRIYTSLPDTFRVDANGNNIPVSWCPPCNALADSLRAKYGKNWQNDIKPFVDIIYTSTRNNNGDVIPLLNPDGSMVDQGPEVGVVPYIGRVGANGQIQRIGPAALIAYIDSSREEMERLMREAAAKAKELPKDVPASRAMPPVASVPKIPDILTFSVKPVDPKDLSKGFIAVDGKGNPIIINGNEVHLDIPGPALNTLISTYPGNPTATYEMNMSTGVLTPPDAGTVIMPRLRPVPDAVLPYLNNPVAVRTETVDGITYQVFRVIIPTPNGVDREGNPIYTYPEREFRVRIPTVAAPVPARIPPPMVVVPAPAPQSVGFWNLFINNLLGRPVSPSAIPPPPQRIPDDTGWTPVLPADPITPEQEAALKKKYEEYVRKMMRNMEEGVKNADE